MNDYNYLGVTVDRSLKLSKQSNKIVGLVKTRLAQLKYIRDNTDCETTMMVYKTMIRPIMEYCAFILDGAPAWVAPKLQVLQNNAIRIAEKIKDARDARVDELHTRHNLEKLQPRRDRQLLGIMYEYAQDQENLLIPVRALRVNANKQLKCPRLGKAIFEKSPFYRGYKLWNDLEAAQQHAVSKEQFLSAIKPQLL